MKAEEFLKKYCFWISINMNDTFGWACADYEQVDIEDIPKILEIEERFGSDGVNAFCAGIRGEDVMDHPELRTQQYYEAKKFLADYKFFTSRGSSGFFGGGESNSNQKKWWEIWK